MRETQRWTSVCRFHGDCILRACALERQSLEVRVPARPLRVGATVPHVSEGCRSVRGHTWFGWPLSSSVRSRGSELCLVSPTHSEWPLYRCSDSLLGSYLCFPLALRISRKMCFSPHSFLFLFEPYPCFLAATRCCQQL